MNMVVDAREFRKGMTGIGRHLENLLRTVSNDPRFRITLVMNDPDCLPLSLRGAGIDVKRIAPCPTLLADQIVLPRLARRANADVFFSPYYKTPLSGRFRRVITVHDIMFLRVPSTPPCKRVGGRIQLAMSSSRADIIFADSSHTRDDLLRTLPRVAGKVRVLYPSIDGAWLDPVAPGVIAQTRRRYAEGRSFFLYVGNFKPHKNVELLIGAFSQLARDPCIGDRHLVIVGDDPANLPRIRRLADSSAASGRIRVHRNVPDKDLRALYAAADWFVTVSEYEGFGYPVLESMAAGCPAICCPRTSIPELVGDNAVFIDRPGIPETASALRRAASMTPAERRNMIDAALGRARDFIPGNGHNVFADSVLSLSPNRHEP